MTEATEHTAHCVQSLVGELRSYKLLSQKKKKSVEKHKNPSAIPWYVKEDTWAEHSEKGPGKEQGAQVISGPLCH